MKTVALVPIKLNSQRIPHKNLKNLSGHPLCWFVPNTLSKVKGIDEVYVYCSDEKVQDYIPHNVKFLKRSSELDKDSVKGFDIYSSFIREIDADIYVLAHTTSPFTRVETIEDALSHVLNGENDSSFSARRVQTFCWYDGKPINYDLNDVPRTQDMKPIFVETSGFFIFKKEIFTEYHRRIGFKPYIKEVDEVESVDIDEPKDFEFAELIAKSLKKEEK